MHLSSSDCGHGRTCPTDPNLRRVYGCDGPALDRVVVTLRSGKDIQVDRCPLFYIDEDTCKLIHMYNLFQDKQLVAGGQLDQPYFWLQVVDIIKASQNG